MIIRKSLFAKIFMTILAFGFCLWFGGSVVRSAIGFDIFYPSAKLELKSHYTNEIRMHSVYLYATTSLYSDIGYFASFVSVLALAIYWRKQLKLRGWLFMSIMLFLVASPVELYFIYCDIKLSLAIYYDQVKDFASMPVTTYFYDRFKQPSMATPSALAFLAIITSVLYIIWRPLDGKSKEIEKNEVEQIPS